MRKAGSFPPAFVISKTPFSGFLIIFSPRIYPGVAIKKGKPCTFYGTGLIILSPEFRDEIPAKPGLAS